VIIRIEYKDSIQHPCVFEDQDCEVYIENSTIGWCLHCYVKNWSKQVYWKLVDVMLLLKEQAPRGELYCIAMNSKLQKFAEMFGFFSVDTLTDRETEESGELMVYA